MKYRNLGRSGLQVSTLCLGTMTFGEADAQSFMHGVGSDVETSFAVMDRALEAGVTFWDTADVYGQDGLSERVIGQWFDDRRLRDRVVLATKFRFRMADGPNGTGAARIRIRRACEASLRRLRTDRIDLYQVHCQDLDTPEEETLGALDDLVREGKVHYVGVSNYAAYRVVEAVGLAERHRYPRYVSMQMQYNLVTRDIEREHVPVAVRHGVGILPWSPLAAGFLTGKIRRDEAPPEGARLAKWADRRRGLDTPRHWATLAVLQAAADELGTSCSAVALAWLIGRPGVASVVFGARDPGQLEANLAAADLVLPDAIRASLDQASGFEAGYPYEFIQRVAGRW